MAYIQLGVGGKGFVLVHDCFRYHRNNTEKLRILGVVGVQSAVLGLKRIVLMLPTLLQQ